MPDSGSQNIAKPIDVLETETASNGATWWIAPFDLLNGSIYDFDALTKQLQEAHKSPVALVRMRVPMRMGRGTAEYFRLSPHLHLLLLDFDLDQDFVVTVPGDRMIKVRVMLAGKLEALQSDISIDGVGAFLEAYPGKIASSYRVLAGTPAKMVILNCAPEFFTEEMRLDWRLLPEPLRMVFEREAGAPMSAQTPLGPDLLHAANDIMRFAGEFPPNLQRAYLWSKSSELASYVIRQLGQPTLKAPSGLKLSIRDVSRVHEARDVLSEQFRRPPPIPKLARLVGLNQTKLKAAFKSVFAMTINEFTIKCRMERGAELLGTTSLSIAEIAHAMGYDHAANFTHAFRRYFGHSPRQMRRAADH